MDEQSNLVLRQVLSLPEPKRRSLLRQLGPMSAMPALSPMRKAFVQEYAIHLNAKRAAENAGYKQPGTVGHNLTHEPAVAQAIQEKLAEREELSDLKADFVRDYIFTILTFCPGDYFRPGPEGAWVIDEASYALVPQKIRRLIESMMLVEYQGQRFMMVTFISKTAALAMASRYTLVQKVEGTLVQIPWDKVVKDVEGIPPDAIERKLEEYSLELKNGNTNGFHG
jgi:hypothetical protein